ncbi:MAG: exodeoxyribonuclease VII small subunit [Parvularculaceae bacterium]|nr:exodeoxyribonuclease VII small subunit [Parvularculaceae bacterium]
MTKDIKKMSFEDALKELEGIIQKLESGEVALEESITLYERGAALKAHCDATLGAARERIEKIVEGQGGQPATEPASFD